MTVSVSNAEHIAVVGGNTGGDGCLDRRMGIYVAVLDWLAADGGDDRAASPTVIAAGPVSAYSVPAWASGSARVAAAHERLSGHASRVRVLDRAFGRLRERDDVWWRAGTK